MENLLNGLKWSGNTLDSDIKQRLPSRPVNNTAFQDLGSSLAPGPSKKHATGAKERNPTSSQSQPRSTGTTKPKPVLKNSATSSKHPASKSTARIDTIVLSSDSDDEMDCLSSQPDHPSSRQSPVPPKRGKAPEIDSRGKIVVRNSREEEEKARSTVLKGLKFTKKQTLGNDDSLTLSTPKARIPTSSSEQYGGAAERLPQSPPWENPSGSHDSSTFRAGGDRHQRIGTLPLTEKNSKSNRSAFAARAPAPKPPARRQNDNPNVLFRSKPRPRDPPVNETKASVQSKAPSYDSRRSQLKSSKSILDMVDASTTLPGSSKAIPSTSRARAHSRSRSRSRYSSGDSSPERRPKKKKAPEDFPTLSPTSSPLSSNRRTIGSFPHMSPLAGSKAPQGARTAIKSKASTSRTLAEFPTLSPTKYDVSDDETSKPKKDKGKGKAPNKENDEDNDGSEKELKKKSKQSTTRQKKLEEFPMNTQMLNSLDSTSPLRPRKRVSEDGSGGEHTPKKSRKEHRSLLELESPRHPFEDEGDSISIAPHVDPKTLCPYCDTPLPSSPSPLLLKILSETKKKAKRDPRPSNPLGLRAPLATFIAACQRHRFESQILPEAEQKGWPKAIDWKGTGSRILKMRHFLKALIEDPGNGASANAGSELDDWEVVHESRKSDKKIQGAKAGSVFWTELMEEVKQKGLRAVSGVRGQFANFEKAQPGYYGEIGSVIIHQTLYNMFPLAEMNPALVSPLTTNEFVQRILVPEVALHLIMEDKRLSGEDGVKNALAILRDSSAYGVAMFPEDGGEWDSGKKKHQEDKIGVGDMIVMERARKRRKELEQEDEREEEQRKADEETERRRLEKAERSKAKRKARDDELAHASSDTNASNPQQPPRPRPRPRPVVRGSSSMSVIDPSLAPVGNTEGETSWTRSRSRSVNIVDTDPSSDTDIYVRDRPHASSVERQRSPSASETRNMQYGKPMPSSTARSRMASLTIGSDSDASKTAAVRKGKRAPSRAPSIPKAATKRSSVLKVSSDDDEIEIVKTSLSPETPMPRRAIAKPYPMDTDERGQDTPKAVPTKKPETPPLLRMQKRKKLAAQSSDTGFQFLASRQKAAHSGKSGKPLPRRGTSDAPIVVPTDSDNTNKSGKLQKMDSHSWLLDNPSSPSQDSHSKFQ